VGIAFHFEYSYKSAHVIMLFCPCLYNQIAFDFLKSVAKLQTFIKTDKQIDNKSSFSQAFCLFSMEIVTESSRNSAQGSTKILEVAARRRKKNKEK